MTDVEEPKWLVGCRLTVKTQNEEIQGRVFAFDKASNTVLLTQTGSTPFHSNLRLLKANYIKVNEIVMLPAVVRLEGNGLFVCTAACLKLACE